MGKELKASDRKAEKLNVKGFERHILLCSGPKCCSEELGDEVWDYLKKRLAELQLANVEGARVFRTNVRCLRICADGPIAVVYPEGTWYRQVNIEACEKIIQSHLINGVPVEELMFAENPLQKREP